jgi:hypothetical protein
VEALPAAGQHVGDEPPFERQDGIRQRTPIADAHMVRLHMPAAAFISPNGVTGGSGGRFWSDEPLKDCSDGRPRLGIGDRDDHRIVQELTVK